MLTATNILFYVNAELKSGWQPFHTRKFKTLADKVYSYHLCRSGQELYVDRETLFLVPLCDSGGRMKLDSSFNIELFFGPKMDHCEV